MHGAPLMPMNASYSYMFPSHPTLKNARHHRHFLFLSKNVPQHVLDQVAIMQFNRREDPVVPSTSTHVKCIDIARVLKGVDSKLPPRADGFNDAPRDACCWQVVLVSPLTGGDIWPILPALEMALQAYSSMGTMVWPSGQMSSVSTGYV